MNAREWKRHILSCIAVELDGHLDSGASYLYEPNGEPISDAEENRMRKVVAEMQDEFRRRARP
jgi:hypothetical protein